jgi:hypothetical protein
MSVLGQEGVIQPISKPAWYWIELGECLIHARKIVFGLDAFPGYRNVISICPARQLRAAACLT